MNNARLLTVALLIAAAASALCSCSSAEEQPYIDPRELDYRQHSVDLGLTVRWATRNLGAANPEDYGNYYAWGDTKTREDYSIDSCKTHNLSTDQLRQLGIAGHDGSLAPSADAATATLGGKWRMPTRAELQELFDSCTWHWRPRTSVGGFDVVGPSGDSIFLPAAGSRVFQLLNDTGEFGYYWTSTPLDTNACTASILYFYCDTVELSASHRFAGLTIRPVCDK